MGLLVVVVIITLVFGFAAGIVVQAMTSRSIARQCCGPYGGTHQAGRLNPFCDCECHSS